MAVRLPRPAAAVAVLALALPVLAQTPGEVRTFVEISDARGGLGLPLSDYDQFGRAVAALGDVDGDGVGDLAVGAHGTDRGGMDRGAVYVLFLQADGTLRDEVEISSTAGGFVGPLADGDQFGRAVSALGDVDGDGVPDLAVGSGKDDDGGPDRGAVWTLLLNADGTVKGERKISSTAGGFAGPLADGDEFGRAIAPLGDLDGDGVPDLAVGAAFDSSGGPERGAVWILFLNADGTVKAAQKIDSFEGGFPVLLKNGDYFGISLAALGDFDGDGLADLAVGAAGDDDSATSAFEGSAGAVYLLFLNSDGTVDSHVKISEATGGLPPVLDPFDWFGFSVANVGDVDANGVTDLAVGAYGDDGPTKGNKGAVHLLCLQADGTVRSHYLLGQEGRDVGTVLEVGDWFGSAVAGMGDFDGDGTPDLVGGARMDAGKGIRRGAVYVMALNGADATVPPVAVFDATPDVGPAPLAVDFTEISSGVVSTWSWDFGDGTSSGQRHPSHVFVEPGTYAVTLTVTGPGGSGTGTRSVAALPPPAPVAAFSAQPTSGSWPLPVAFTDLSTGEVTSWSWDFGDGAGSTLASPAHVYGAAGAFAASLTVTGPGGSDTTGTTVTVTAPAPPVAAFSTSPEEGERPLPVSFADLSTGPVSSWSWDFGDGATSSAASPSHLYDLAGTFAVELTVAGPGGTDTAGALVTVTEPPPPVALFAAAPTEGGTPLDVAFTDLSTGRVSSWSWDFGDGTTSREASPRHTYVDAGTYTVSLFLSGPAGTDVLVQPDLVTAWDVAPPPVPAFSATPTTGEAPLTVRFTDLSQGEVTAWTWEFGNGLVSRRQNPSNTYFGPGTYSVALTAEGPSGTARTLQQDLIVVVAPPPPVADFTAEPTTGEAPLAVAFQDLSSGWINARSWSFGDGESSTATSPIHVYQLPGTYDVTLTVEGPYGQGVETKLDLVHAQAPPPPVAAFEAAPLAGFAPLAVAFTDLTAGAPTSWSWDFGDGSTSAEPHPAHVYADPGTYAVTLVARNPGGESTAVTPAAVVVRAVPDAGLPDGGFEAMTPGQPPPSPWYAQVGAGHAVRSSALGGADGFPTDGVQWLELSGDGVAPGAPPSNPGGAGALPAGGAGLALDIRHPPGQAALLADVAFLLASPAGAPTPGDWLSLDVTDGTTAVNLFFADGASSFPRTSLSYGLAMTALRTVRADLAELFPGSDEETPFTLRLSISTTSAGASAARGYVDRLRFATVAAAVTRYGCTNPAGSLVHLSGVPALGTKMRIGVDNPLGTQAPGSATVLLVSLAPDPAYPCGSVWPGGGLQGGGADGEVLVDLGPPLVRGFFGPAWLGPGSPAPYVLPIPPLSALVGRRIHLQGLLIDPTAGAEVPVGWTDALELRVGP